MFKKIQYLIPLLFMNISLASAGSYLGDSTIINTKTQSIVTLALGDKSQAITRIGSIHHSRVQNSTKININTEQIINIAKGNNSKAMVFIGSLENTQTNEIDANIHIQNIYNISDTNQTNKIIIGYHE